jgi:Tol biopolymer transport system component
VYFIAPGVLTTLPNALGQTASLGEKNLYGYDTENGETKFVAALSPQDSIEMGLLGKQGAQVTPDGRYLIFDTYAHLVGDDANAGQAVYRYDFNTGELTWISHGAAGVSPTEEGMNATVAIKPSTSALPSANDANRAIAEDGSYVVFSTSERLQASDVNGAPNVYLWHDGAVSMISDGHDPAGASYPVISASGADVFFETREQLVGQDTDTLADIYDARIGGGFPAPTPEPSCSGESCQGTPSGPHSLGGSGTSSFTGGGNLTPGSTAFPPPEEPKAKPLTRAQKLAKALKQCKKDKSKKKRTSCEKEARKKYGPVKKK